MIAHHLESALHAEVSWVGDHDVSASLADVATMQEDAAALQRYAPLAEELAVRHGHVLYQAVAQRAWGVAHRLAGEYAEAEARLHRALDLFRGLETHWQIGRTCHELGVLAAAQGDRDAAAVHFTDALAEFETMRAGPDAARTRVALAGPGVDPK